jgi:glycosyltransferase involved in cell wall biosynthesis
LLKVNPIKISFFGSVRNDWAHASQVLKTISSTFWFLQSEIVLVDDNSITDQIALAQRLELKHKNLFIQYNTKHQGIVASLNQAIDGLSGNIAIPIAGDTEFIDPFYGIILVYAFIIQRVDFLFAKTRHVDVLTKETCGITGWSAKKGVQQKNNVITNFISGQTRPSGSAVAFRTRLLKQYRYDKNLASLSDFYLNNLMILKHKSFYYGKVVSKTLERKASYSNSFNQEQSLALVEKTVTKYESNGVILTDAQKSRYREYERSQ